MLEKLGRGAARHHWWVIAAWLVVLVVLVAVWQTSGGRLRDVFTIPGTESQEAVDLFEERFPSQNLPTATVVLHAESGTLESGAHRTAVEAAITALAKMPDVESVTDPYNPELPQVSKDGSTARATVTWSVNYADVPKDTLETMDVAVAPAERAGLEVELGGGMVDILSGQGGAADHADEIGLLVALLVMLLAFGSLIAAGLPLANALFGIGTATSLLYVLANVFTIGTVAPILGSMIGLGVGVDYALFIVTRYREQLASGAEPREAAGRALATAGSAVLFAGLTVCLALIGLIVARVPYVTMLGLSAALVVVVMVLVSLTLLPALLGLVGRRIDSLRIPLPRRKGPVDPDRTFWAGWARGVAHHPWPCLLVGVTVLVLLASPVLSMRLGFATDGDEPKSETQRRAYDLIAEAFGPGANGPLLLAIELPKPTAQNERPDLAAIEKLTAAVKSTTGVQEVSPPLPNASLTAAVVLVQPTTDPNAEATKDLVRTLRGKVIPRALDGSALSPDRVFVGGATAELIDLTDRINDRLEWTILVVVIGAFVLLLVVFRSILVPLKAAVMNLLSIGAAYGVVVAVFQWGWAKSLVGLEQTVPIEAFVPLMMFAILFGLSMDYEVFLLSRVREEYARSHDSRESVVAGLSKTARVISSAALIMISVFLSFVTSNQVVVKMLGVGLAAAVFVDATLVRLVLVPAVMELMGKGTWWFPRWLDRIVPHVEIDKPLDAP